MPRRTLSLLRTISGANHDALTWRQFLELWATRDDAQLKGHALAVLPLRAGVPTSDFFTPAVANPLPVELLTIRRW